MEKNVSVETNRGIVLPLYLNCYDYVAISLYEISCVYVVAKESLDVKAYNAQKNKIETLSPVYKSILVNRNKKPQNVLRAGA